MLNIRFHIDFNQIKQKIPPLTTIDQKSLSFFRIVFRIVITVSIIILVIFVCAYILKKDDGYSVQPFETIGVRDNGEGKPLATLLGFYLQNIKNIYETGPDETVIQKSIVGSEILSRPLGNFSIPHHLSKKVQLDYSLSQIGTVGAEGVSLSIGSVLLFIKGYLGRGPNTITCSLQRYNSTITLVAILEDHEHDRTMTFENNSIISNDEQIPSLIKDLSYKISLALCKQSKSADQCPQNWQTFKYVTQGRDAYNRYMLTRDINDLNNGYNMTMSAKKFEPDYNGTFELLSDIGFCYIECKNYDNYDREELIFKNISHFMPFESALGLGLVYGNKGIYTEALYAFDKAIQLRQNNALVWYDKGLILSDLGNYSNYSCYIEAVKAFNKVIDLDQKDATYARAWYGKGNALLNLGNIEENNSSRRYNEAITAYSKAIEIKSQDTTIYTAAWYGKGGALAILGNIEENNRSRRHNEAITAYSKAIELDPNFAEAWVNKGAVLAALYQYADSINAYDEAIKIKPNFAVAWYYKSKSLKALGHDAEANDAFQKAKEMGFTGGSGSAI